MVNTPQTISRNVAFCSQSVNNPMGCVSVGFAPPHTLLVFLHSIWVLLLFQKQRVCAASVISRGEKERKLPTSRLHYSASASAGWSRAIHFASGEKGQRRRVVDGGTRAHAPLRTRWINLQGLDVSLPVNNPSAAVGQAMLHVEQRLSRLHPRCLQTAASDPSLRQRKVSA